MAVDPHVLHAVIDEPLEEGLVILGELDLGLILGIERRHDIDHHSSSQRRASSQIDPVFVLAERAAGAAIARRAS